MAGIFSTAAYLHPAHSLEGKTGAGSVLPAIGVPRIAALDFVRGVALLGILTINITGFWGPTLATFSPHWPRAEPGGDTWFLIAFVLFEGKMRALFTLLFGASMVLFIAAADQRGAWGPGVQARRLVWLAVIGYGHYALLWWGDILFAYALCGLAALVMCRAPARLLIALGLGLFMVSHAFDALGAVLGIAAEQAVLAGHAPAADRAEQAAMLARIAASISDDRRVLLAPFGEAVRLRLTLAPWLPLQTTVATFTETFPLMLIGMGLHRTGLWRGEWSRRALVWLAGSGIGAGGAMTLALAWWIDARDFAPRVMFGVMTTLSALPHLAMALGYGAALMLAWPKLSSTAPARLIAAAGQTALTNYIGTTVAMSALFAGWGLGLGGWLGRGWLPLFIPLGWAAMLVWPQWWLARHRHGPLEAVWRRLTWLGTRQS